MDNPLYCGENIFQDILWSSTENKEKNSTEQNGVLAYLLQHKTITRQQMPISITGQKNLNNKPL
jgi:hypothetical protein